MLAAPPLHVWVEVGQLNHSIKLAGPVRDRMGYGYSGGVTMTITTGKLQASTRTHVRGIASRDGRVESGREAGVGACPCCTPRHVCKQRVSCCQSIRERGRELCTLQ